MAIKSVKDYGFKKLFNFISVGGKAVTAEHAEARKEICIGCSNFGQVEPVPKLKMAGCKLCGCPSVTKPHMLTLPRLKDKQGQPLTISEMLQLKVAGKLRPEDLVDETIKCPDPEGNRWEQVDKNFSIN